MDAWVITMWDALYYFFHLQCFIVAKQFDDKVEQNEPKALEERRIPVPGHYLNLEDDEVIDINDFDPERFQQEPLFQPPPAKTRKPSKSIPVPVTNDSAGEEEIADVDLQYDENGRLNVEFVSHGRKHRLKLVDNAKQPHLADIPIKLLGMSAEEQDEFQEDLKVSTRYMKSLQNFKSKKLNNVCCSDKAFLIHHNYFALSELFSVTDLAFP